MSTRDFRLGEWIVRTDRCCVERGNETRRIKPKAMQVLLRLQESRGDVVSKSDLFDAVWPNQSVTDDVLTNCVVELRKAFDDSPREPRYIETIPTRGFRLVADVLPVETGLVGMRLSRWRWSAAAIAIIAAIGYLWTLDRMPVPPENKRAEVVEKSIAVLPFVDMSPERDQEYFADGLSEELINQLTQIDDLQVIGRTSSFFFKGRNEDLRVIGEALSVRYVLEGSVRKSDSRLRITAQLIDVSDGFHLWSDTYDRDFEDIFAIQQDIAASVARALSIRLSVGEIGRIVGGTTNVEAFESAMLGVAAHHKLNANGTLEAIEQLRRATELDPNFAIAWAKLANVYRTAWLSLGSDQRDMWSRLADEAIARAAALTPDADYVFQTAAYIEVDRQNWVEARRLFDAALEVRPTMNPLESGGYLDLLTKAGSIDEALEIEKRFTRIDPLHPDYSMYLAHLHLSRGDVVRALEENDRGYGLDGFRAAISQEGLVAALSSGDEAAIVKWLNRSVDHEQPGAKGVHSAMLERFRNRDESLRFLRSGFVERSQGKVPMVEHNGHLVRESLIGFGKMKICDNESYIILLWFLYRFMLMRCLVMNQYGRQILT